MLIIYYFNKDYETYVYSSCAFVLLHNMVDLEKKNLTYIYPTYS